MLEPNSQKMIGVLGGMGPLASAEFVRRLYYYTVDQIEQKAPIVIHYSDPTMPDRSTYFLAGKENVIYERLIKSLEFLVASGAERIVICCFTIHHLLPKLPTYLRERIISLNDIVVDQLSIHSGPFLFLSTNGTRRMRVLERHDLWSSIQNRVIFPSAGDQIKIHDLVYTKLKHGIVGGDAIDDLIGIISSYAVNGFIAACTEFHLLTGSKDSRLNGYTIVDPLDFIAKKNADVTSQRYRVV